MESFLKLFADPKGKGFTFLQVSSFEAQYIPYIKGLGIPPEKDVWFTPAYRSKKNPKKKESVKGTVALWADIDATRHLPECAFKPSIIIDSGHGYHLYWLLDKPITDVKVIEDLNGIIRDTLGSDSVQNANRIMRVPGTTNNKHVTDDKYDQPCAVVKKRFEPLLKYRAEDFLVLRKLAKKVQHIVRTGDSRGYNSRSERDWGAITGLLKAGASERLIKIIFESQPVGDKAQEENSTYLERSIKQARASISHRIQTVTIEQDEIEGIAGLHQDDEKQVYLFGYHNHTKEISTFLLKPKVILKDTILDNDRRTENEEDVMVVEVHTRHSQPVVVEFPKGAFDSARTFHRMLRDVNWSWLATERELRGLLPYLMDQARSTQIPNIAATPVQGLHQVNGSWFFVGDSSVLTATAYLEGHISDIVWLPSNQAHPIMKIKPDTTPAQLQLIGELLPKINVPQVSWPIIGWFAASVMKPWIEQTNLRFPVLNVTGIRGSGKTATLEHLLIPLFGNHMIQGAPSDGTPFTRLTLLGCSNAIPIEFGEYRVSNNYRDKFDHDIRMTYDTGRDMRGRADQSTVSYDLVAPVVINGEDSLAHDPALKQRIVLVELLPDYITESKDANKIFKELQDMLPSLEGFAGYYIQQCLQMIESGEADKLLKKARKDHRKHYTQELPDRVRNNQIVTLFGIYLFCDITGTPKPEIDVLEPSLMSVFNLEMGRDSLLVDDFVVDIANKCQAFTAGNQYNKSFPFFYDQEENSLYFQLAPTYGWWITQRSRGHRPTLASDSIRSQLRTQPYYEGVRKVDSVLMYGVSLPKAAELGLDLPSVIKRKGPKLGRSASPSHNGKTASSEEKEKEQKSG